MDLEKIKENISKTGFPLEFKISEILSNDRWAVINGKYYVDDLEGKAREVDVLAYKVSKVDHFRVYTVLIVSCKKDADNAWVFLSKKRDKKDPNFDQSPVCVWSNDKALRFMQEQEIWKNNYLTNIENSGCEVLNRTPNNHIFAFQKMNKKNGNPQNDKVIFEAMTSVMKAQIYEKNRLPSRKEEPCVYQFNLLSVCDTQFVRANFTSGGKVEPEEISEQVHLANYIIDRQETSATIHFIRSIRFQDVLKQYSNLHKANLNSFNLDCENFYSDLCEDRRKLKLFEPEIIDNMIWVLRRSLRKIGHKEKIDTSDLSLRWKSSSKALEFLIDLKWDVMEKLNDDDELTKKIKGACKKYLRYEGPCAFMVAAPF